MTYSAGVSFCIILLIAIPCAHAAATTAPDPDNDPVAFIADSQKALEPWKSLPVLPPEHISDVVRFREEAGMLTIDWPMLHDGPKNGRIPLLDLPGEACIACRGMTAPHHNVYPTFEYWDLTEPDHLARHLQVFSSPTFLAVYQDTEGIHNYIKIVSLLENIVTSDSPPVSLRVQMISGSAPTRNIVLTAQTLDELLLDHHEDFETYLRPMFQMFHQESAVFMMDDRIDWQVLAAQWHAPPGLDQTVQQVIARLNSPEFAQRQQAEKDLGAIGEPAALYLHAADRYAWSAEETARINAFLGQYFLLSDEQAKKYSTDRNFLLECLAADDADLQSAAVRQLDIVLGRKIDDILNQPPTERNRSIATLRQNSTP